MKRIAMYVLTGVIVCTAGTVAAENAAPADDAFDNLAAAVKCFSDMFSTDGSWPVVSRGGSSMFVSDSVRNATKTNEFLRCNPSCFG